jgi:hypothetical protein
MAPAFHLARTGDDRQRPVLTEDDRANGDDRRGGDGLIQDEFLCWPTMPGSSGWLN